MLFTQDASTDLGSDDSDLGLLQEDTTRLTFPGMEEEGDIQMDSSLQAPLPDPEAIPVAKWAARLELESLTMKKTATEEFNMVSAGLDDMNMRLRTLEKEAAEIGDQMQSITRGGDTTAAIGRLERLIRGKAGSGVSQELGTNASMNRRLEALESLISRSLRRLEDQRKRDSDRIKEVVLLCIDVKQNMATFAQLTSKEDSPPSELTTLRAEMFELKNLILQVMPPSPNQIPQRVTRSGARK